MFDLFFSYGIEDLVFLYGLAGLICGLVFALPIILASLNR
jgi:tetrahydromethanopterin S-methyltransferase subunit F